MQNEDYATVIIRYVWSVNRVIVSTASSLSLRMVVAQDMLCFVTKNIKRYEYIRTIAAVMSTNEFKTDEFI